MVILQDSILNGYYLLAGCKVAKNNCIFESFIQANLAVKRFYFHGYKRIYHF